MAAGDPPIPRLSSDDDGEETGFLEPGLQPRPGQRPWLMVIGGPASAGLLFELTGEQMTIGRAPEADIRLDEDGVSRMHARIQILPGGVVKIFDLESINGLVVNGMKTKSHVVRDGERVRIGRAVLTLLHVDDVGPTLRKNLAASLTRIDRGKPSG